MTRSRVITTSTADAGGHDLLHGTDGPPTAVADRAAIEARARELDDNDWRDVFNDDKPHGPGVGPRAFSISEARALLAYLDRVWAGRANDDGSVSLGLTRREKSALETDPVQAGGGTLAMLYGRGLIDTHGHQTPLGRAVLRRAKEQGHAGA